MGNRRMIDEAFGREVQALLNDGYQFFTPSMAGHQLREIAKADFIKGTQLVCVLLQSFNEREKENEYSGYELIVGTWDWKNHNFGHAPTYKYGSHYTVFNEHLIPQKKIRFYCLNDDRSDYQAGFGTKEEALAAKKKRRSRSRLAGNVRYNDWKPNREHMKMAKKAILPLIHKIPGLKTVKLSDIDDVCRTTRRLHGNDIATSHWYCYVRGKQFDYCRQNGVYYYNKHFVKKDGNWIRTN